MFIVSELEEWDVGVIFLEYESVGISYLFMNCFPRPRGLLSESVLLCQLCAPSGFPFLVSTDGFCLL